LYPKHVENPFVYVLNSIVLLNPATCSLMHLQHPNDSERGTSSQQTDCHSAECSPSVSSPTTRRAGEMRLEDAKDDEDDGGDERGDEETE
jgi:hypothetical protein